MFFGSSKARKRKFRYRVTVKGVTISKHYTKTTANQKAKSIRGARVVAIATTRKKSYRKKSYGRRRY